MSMPQRRRNRPARWVYRDPPETRPSVQIRQLVATPGSGYRVLRPGLVLDLVVDGVRCAPRRVQPFEVEVEADGRLPFIVGNEHGVSFRAPGVSIGPLPAEVIAVTDAGTPTATLAVDPGDLQTVRLLLGLLRTLVWQGVVVVPGSRLVPAEVIADEKRVRRLVGAFASGRSPVRLGVPGSPERAHGWVLSVADDGPLPLVLSIDDPTVVPPVEVEIAGYSSAFLFHLDAGVREGRLLRAPLPERVARTRTRRHRRVPAPVASEVRFRHPAFPEIETRRPLHDLSLGGFAFESHPLRDAVHPGLAIPEVEVLWPGGETLTVGGVIRHLSDGATGDAEVCGFEIDVGREAWHDRVERVLYPNTHLGTGFAEGLWELYVRSGYFNLSGKDEGGFEPVRRAFAGANRAIADAGDVACQVVWPSPRGIEAAVTVVKPYRHTWLAYQLARRPGEIPVPTGGRQILRDVLLHGFEYPLRDPEMRWFVTWVQEDGRFSRYLVHDLARRWAHEPDLASLVRFRALEAPVERSFEVAPGVTVGEPTEAERRALVDLVGRTRSHPYAEAHDLVEGRLDLAETRACWATRGLRRDRALRVARLGDRPIAFAVLESAEEGLHLFGLFDIVRFFPMTAEATVGYTALLENARHWYRAAGKNKLVLFLEDEWPGVLDAGLTDLGFADMAILSATLLPDQLEHAWEITA